MSVLRSLKVVSMISSGMLLAAPTFAEEIELDGIVVTGERVERSVSETASSVVVITSEDLERAPENVDLNDVIENVPNIVLPGPDLGPFIRGQGARGPVRGGGAFFAGVVPRASVVFDGRAISYNELIYGTGSIWDVETIEVFRGPQTTAQGANAIAGAIYVKTKDPTFSPEIGGLTQFSSFKGRRYAGVLSGPLVADQLAGRVSFEFNDQNNFVRFANPAFTLGSGASLDHELLNARLKLLWKPVAIPGFENKTTLTHVETNSPQTNEVTSVNTSLNDRTDEVSISRSVFENRINAIINDTEYSPSPEVTFFNQVQFSDIRVIRKIFPANLGDARIDATDFANEFRTNFNLFDDKLTGVAGVYYRRQESEDFLNFLGPNVFDDEKTGLGIFSELTWKFADRWSFTGGVRYQRDRQVRTGSSPFIPTALSFDGTFDAVLPRFALAYELSPEVTLGALVSRGYNPGGILLSALQQAYIPFKKETLWNYELFARTSFLSGRLNVNANLFYTDFKDAQRQQSTAIPATNLTDLVVLNAEDARSYGVEVSGNYAVTDWFQLNGGFGLLETEFKRFSAAVANLQGNEFQQAPGFMFNAGFDWEMAEGLTFGASVRHTDDYFSDDINTRSLGVNAFTVADFKLSYEPDERFKIFGYINNAFDSAHATNRRAQPNMAGGQDIFITIERPREFGIGGSFKLN